MRNWGEGRDEKGKKRVSKRDGLEGEVKREGKMEGAGCGINRGEGKMKRRGEVRSVKKNEGEEGRGLTYGR